MSYTISYSNPPCGTQDLINSVSSIGGQNNNFTVSQSMAGIVNSGSESCASLSVSGTSAFTGVCTFTSSPVFSSGISVPSEIDLGTLSVSGLSSLNGGLSVSGALTLPSASIADSALSSNIPLKNGLNTYSAVNTFSSPPVMSGASISIASIPGSSIVNNSINGGQIALGGIAQGNVSNGYVDLTSNQTVVGSKSFSSPLIVNSTTTVNNTATFNSSIIASAIGASTITAGGLVTCNSGLTVSSGTLTCGTLSCTSEIDSGAGSFAGLLSANAGLIVPSNQNATFNGGILLPISQTSLSIVAGSVAVDLKSLSYNEFILSSSAFTANISAMVFSNVIVNAKFNIYIIGGAANHNVNKALNSGTVLQVNNLAGNTQFGALSVWRCEGAVLSSTLVALQFTNYT